MVSSIGLFNDFIYESEKYEGLSDKELIQKIRNSDNKAERYLCKRYAFIVKKIVSSFFIMGGSVDDLFQEAMIGFLKAVNGYNIEYDCNFRSFAELCIRRQIVSAIRKTKNNDLLNRCISIYDTINSENGEIVFDKLQDKDSLNPEDVFISKEEFSTYQIFTTEILSSLEKSVLREFGKGKSYEEIALTLHRDIKSIDNALQRIKKKIRNNKEKFSKDK